MQKYYQYVFSIRYVLPNLYNYLITKPRIAAEFPYIIPPQDPGFAIFSYLDLPPIYNKGCVTGFLFIAPFLVFAGIPILSMLTHKKSQKDPIHSDRTTLIYKWTILSLLGSFFFGFAPLAAFFWIETRYLGDFMPSIFLLSILGFWQGDQALTSQPARRKIYWIVGISLIVISVVVSTLLALYINAYEFRRFDTGV